MIGAFAAADADTGARKPQAPRLADDLMPLIISPPCYRRGHASVANMVIESDARFTRRDITDALRF